MSYWNFPSVIGGNINSINNAGLETFRDNALDSLTREICQNSLDAVKDSGAPVVVEFQKFHVNNLDFPGYERLLEVFNQCNLTWRGRNKKSEEFIAEALRIIKNPNIAFLRISDFNTIGLKGAETGELGTPWSSLVKEAGSSNKGDESGGSFGIGKAAPFLNSHLRTLFYSSYDETGYQSHIGVANIMSYRKQNNEITVGNGYYTDNQESNAIKGMLSLDSSFTRGETGTDIYVSAFYPSEDWENEIIQSVLHNFFITVYSNKLIVRVNGFEINHTNIGSLILNMKDTEENRLLKNYYEVLTSEKTIKIPYPAQRYKHGIRFGEGEAQLYLINGDDLNRRVLMTRKTGMRIFEQKNISGSISFTGILMITGSSMNSIFKELENPAHNGWMPNRYEKDPKLANKIYSDLRNFIRQQVKEIFSQNTSDVMDAVGLSDFLPNRSLLSAEGPERAESISPKIKSLSFKKKENESTKKKVKRGKRQQEESSEEELIGKFGFSPGELGGNGHSEAREGGDAGGGANEPDGTKEIDKEKEGQRDKKQQKQNKTKPVRSQQRYICTDKENGHYTFKISTEKAIKEGLVEFTLLGEQSDILLPIIAAHFQNEDVTVAKITGNQLYFSSEMKQKMLQLEITVDYSEYCAMEVEVFENQ